MYSKFLAALAAVLILNTSAVSAATLLASSYSTGNVLKFDGATGAYNGAFASGGGLDAPFYLGVAPVPIPAAVWLFGSALAGMGVIGGRKGGKSLLA